MSGLHPGSTRIWTGDLPIFAREQELAFLRELLERSRAGTGNLTLLCGEAGIGKTALVHELARHAEQDGTRVLLGRAFDLAGTPPFQAWREALQPALGVKPFGDNAEQSPAKVSCSEHQMFEALGDSLRDLTSVTPLLLILEDIHWADSSTLDLLRYISRSLHEMRLSILATYRDDHHAAAPGDDQSLLRLVRESIPPANRIQLSGLDAEATREIVRSHCELRPDDEARLVEYLVERSGGNPLFINELLRSLEEDSTLEQRNGSWILGELRQLPVPTLIRHVIEQRLARLNTDTISLLQVAAVIGQDVPVELWHSVSSVSEDYLIEIADEPIRMNVLEPDARGIDLCFSHALVRETLYEMLTVPRRRVWHRRVAEAMARDELDPATVAFHFDRAGDRRAIKWYVRAGSRAMSTSWSASTRAYERALELMERFEVPAETIGWMRLRLGLLFRFARPQRALQQAELAMQDAQHASDAVLGACARYLRGSELFVMGQIEPGVSEMIQAVNALSQLETRDRKRYARLAESWFHREGLAPAANLVAVLAHQGDFSAVHKLNPDSADASQRWQDLTQHVTGSDPHALAGFAIASAATGNPVTSRDTFSEALDAFGSIGEHVLAGSTAMWANHWLALPYLTDDAAFRSSLAECTDGHWSQAKGAQGGWTPQMAWLPVWLHEGDWERARSAANEALARPAASPRTELACMVLAILARERDNHPEARQFIARVLPQGPDTRPGSVYYYPALESLALAASMSFEAGEIDDGQQWLDAHWRWLEWSGAALGHSRHSLLRAMLARATGNIDAAIAAAESSLRLAGDPRQPLALVHSHRLLGELYSEIGDRDLAEEHLRTAVQLSISCRSPLEEALSTLALVRSVPNHSHGDTSFLLGRVHELASNLNARRILRLLDEVRTIPERGIEFPDATNPLSAREQQVLRLLVSGARNSDIASQLFVSRRTVEQHLRSIYQKLGVRSRVEATRHALENNLT